CRAADARGRTGARRRRGALSAPREVRPLLVATCRLHVDTVRPATVGSTYGVADAHLAGVLSSLRHCRPDTLLISRPRPRKRSRNRLLCSTTTARSANFLPLFVRLLLLPARTKQAVR